MKKMLFAIVIISLATACKKSTSDNTETSTTVFIQVEGVDNDNITTTIAPVLTVNVIQ
jgi:hypothetical protein